MERNDIVQTKYREPHLRSGCNAVAWKASEVSASWLESLVYYQGVEEQ
jgi:hypothetical protein